MNESVCGAWSPVMKQKRFASELAVREMKFNPLERPADFSLLLRECHGTHSGSTFLELVRQGT